MYRSIIILYLMVCLPLFQCREIGDITDNAQSEVIANNNIKYASNPSLNILFSAWFGGMSHARPQLQMADILVERGHRVTFASFDNVLDLWLADHPNITPYGIGKDTHDTAELKAIMWDYMMKEYDLQSLATKEMLELLIIKFYKKHFQLFHDWIVTNKPDVVVCDFFVSGCYDAAYETGTPFVITSNMLSYQDMEHAPYLSDLMSYLPSTHETTGFLDRFYDKLIRPALYYWDLRNTTQLRNSIAAELNISTYEFMADRWKQGFVLVNNFFGLEIPRALSPNVFLVGPCMPRNYPPLSDELKLFLGNHKRTVYVGFGSNMILSSWRMTLLLRSLISAHADGLIDGVVWGLMNTATAGDHIPTSLTIDGTVHTISDMRSGKHLFIRMMDRAPQRAVLEHPSTILFITHCGIASIYETMFAGVPILGLPIFGDQPSNAIRMYEHGAGLWLRRSETNEKTLGHALYRLLLRDTQEYKRFRDNALLLQRTIRIIDNTRDYAPNLIELAAIPGAIKAHETADKRMPWWQSRNYDIYAFTVLLLLSTSYLLVASIRYMYMLVSSKQYKQKED